MRVDESSHMCWLSAFVVQVHSACAIIVTASIINNNGETTRVIKTRGGRSVRSNLIVAGGVLLMST